MCEFLIPSASKLKEEPGIASMHGQNSLTDAAILIRCSSQALFRSAPVNVLQKWCPNRLTSYDSIVVILDSVVLTRDTGVTRGLPIHGANVKQRKTELTNN